MSLSKGPRHLRAAFRGRELTARVETLPVTSVADATNDEPTHLSLDWSSAMVNMTSDGDGLKEVMAVEEGQSATTAVAYGLNRRVASQAGGCG